jgi:hypothetical protein
MGGLETGPPLAARRGRTLHWVSPGSQTCPIDAKRVGRAYFGGSYLHGCAAPERAYVKLAASHLYAVQVIDLKLRASARSQSTFSPLSNAAFASAS